MNIPTAKRKTQESRHASLFALILLCGAFGAQIGSHVRVLIVQPVHALDDLGGRESLALGGEDATAFHGGRFLSQ